MNTWTPVKIDNIPINSLEGLIGIEECKNYDLEAVNAISKPNIRSDQKRGKKTLSKISKLKSSKKIKKQTKAKVADLSPSKQGCTENDVEENKSENYQKIQNVKSWMHLPLQKPLLRALALLNFTEPTNIQSLTLPAAILGKRDILGAAETGSGKTLAFGLPILHSILNIKENLKLSSTKLEKKKILQMNFNEVEEENIKLDSKGIGLVKCIDNVELPEDTSRKPLYALILTPTRELAIQVKQHLSNLAKFTDINITVVIGGMSVEKQLRLLAKQPEIIVATPGRLWELIEEGNAHLSQINNIRFLAIDETDRMLEKGHFQELQKILERVNIDDSTKERRQNFVFSATLTLVHELPKYLITKKKVKMSSKISDLTPAQKLQKIVESLGITNPKVVDVTQGKGIPQTLTECRITCSINEKDYYVYYFVMKHPGRTLIFCNSIGCVRRLVTILSLLKCNPLPLHSALHQRQRLKNLDKFKELDNSILIATDVAARGLDISCIQHVIHYQTPRTSESYVHRSGRTARASNEGITVLLVEPGELQQYLRLCRTLGKVEDLPLFPIQENMLAAVKDRVNLARELDKLELSVKKSNSEAGWIQKAANEMDIILDDDFNKYDKSATQGSKKVADIKRKNLNALLQKPIFPKNFSMKYPLSSLHLNNAVGQNNEINNTDNAVEIMKNAIKSNTVTHSLKVKHLFKPKIRKTQEHVNLNSFLKKKNSNSKRHFKNNGRKKNKKR